MLVHMFSHNGVIIEYGTRPFLQCSFFWASGGAPMYTFFIIHILYYIVIYSDHTSYMHQRYSSTLNVCVGKFWFFKENVNFIFSRPRFSLQKRCWLRHCACMYDWNIKKIKVLYYKLVVSYEENWTSDSHGFASLSASNQNAYISQLHSDEGYNEKMILILEIVIIMINTANWISFRDRKYFEKKYSLFCSKFKIRIFEKLFQNGFSILVS